MSYEQYALILAALADVLREKDTKIYVQELQIKTLEEKLKEAEAYKPVERIERKV